MAKFCKRPTQLETKASFGWGESIWNPINNLVYMAGDHPKLQSTPMVNNQKVIPYDGLVDSRKRICEEQEH
jgi:hypothetical protein